MIISASRRTDIPAYYSDWFLNRIREGFVLARNPVNVRQISKVSLSPDVVDGIVFWTKNPTPMFDKLSLLRDYTAYFQFTITPYSRDVEPDVPSKPDVIIPAFQRLSDLIGIDKVIWRFDPIMVNNRYTVDYHIRAFDKIAGNLGGYTKKCTISFIDLYRKTEANTKKLNLTAITEEIIFKLSKVLADIAHSYGLQIDTCAEKTDLQQYGIKQARCIDGRLFEKLLGSRLNVKKDKSQRPECGCAAAIDIGMYNTCGNGCRYCYANYSGRNVRNNIAGHNPLSPLLFGEIRENDIVKERTAASLKDHKNRFQGFI
jgi:DNA repair photolyase